MVVTVNASATLNALQWGADYSGGGYEILATFTRDLSKSAAESTSNYRISGTSDMPATATLNADNRHSFAGV